MQLNICGQFEGDLLAHCSLHRVGKVNCVVDATNKSACIKSSTQGWKPGMMNMKDPSGRLVRVSALDALASPRCKAHNLSALVDVTKWERSTCSQFDGPLVAQCTAHRVGKTRCAVDATNSSRCRRVAWERGLKRSLDFCEDARRRLQTPPPPPPPPSPPSPPPFECSSPIAHRHRQRSAACKRELLTLKRPFVDVTMFNDELSTRRYRFRLHSAFASTFVVVESNLTW